MKNSRAILLLCFWALLAVGASAQTPVEPLRKDYEAFQQQRRADYQAFKDSTREQYHQFLQQRWSDYRLFLGDAFPQRPQQQPQADSADTDTNCIAPGRVYFYQPEEEIETAVDARTDYVAQVFTFDFYQTPVVFNFPVATSQQRLSNLQPRALTHFWQDLNASGINGSLQQLVQSKQNLALNDWGFFEMLRQLAAQVYPRQYNEQAALVVYLLNELHYNAKIGRLGDHLAMLIPCSNRIFAIPYMEIAGNRYYIFFPGTVSVDHNAKLSSYDIDYPKADRKVSLSLLQSPKLGTNGVGSFTTHHKQFRNADITLHLPMALLEFLDNYPCTDLAVYANAAVGPSVKQNLIHAFQPLCQGKSSTQAVSLLLSYLNTFAYRADQQPFFCEQNYSHDHNDCEDRAILFSYLVRNLLHLDVVLLEFPDHVATAVCFADNSVQGNYILCRDKKYIVCDPTLRDARIGQLASHRRSQSPNVIFLK